jgi:hypothetical protein
MNPLIDPIGRGAFDLGYVKNMIGNTKLVGGHIDQNSNHERIFNFFTMKGIFSYNESTEEFKSKLQIR